jgi:hypothetical protein
MRGRIQHFVYLLLALAVAGSCAKTPRLVALPNQRPRVVITTAPAAGSQIGTYAYDISWAGYDADGSIDHFLYSVDPPTSSPSETTWTKTDLSRRQFQFTADSAATGNDFTGHRYHTVVVKAVDDRGGISAPASVSFNVLTIVPTVQISSPATNPLLDVVVASDLHISWLGNDPDGRASHLPVRYKYLVLGPSSVPSQVSVLADPDTLMRLAAPTFAGWDSLPGTATGVDLQNLNQGATYLFVIVAFDEAGAYSRPLSLDSNVLRFQVAVGAPVGPRLRLFNNYFDFAFTSGGFFTDPRQQVPVDLASDQPIVFNWNGTPSPGTFVTGYRWSQDIASLEDETPRPNEATDIHLWSQWTLAAAATLPAIHPSGGVGIHFFYLEARDNVGAVSLAIVRFTVVSASFDRPLLIVDDTRYLRDTRITNGCPPAPRGLWPTAAELDTFLFAAGNKPWRCYPTGTVSTPGIFAGYDYDSLVTYGLGPQSLTLTKLRRYRNIIWLVNGSFVLNPNINDQYPMLRQLSAPGVTNPLLVWLGLGGKLWLMGGGDASATVMDWKKSGTTAYVYSSVTGELSPARFVYAFPHWQSEITTDNVARAVRSPRAVGGWAGAPDYSLLPAALLEKSSATDVAPPNRTNQSDFYQTNFVGEYLTKPNAITETFYDANNNSTVASVLDTLYETQGSTAGIGRPIMTLYHGTQGPPVVESGFPLWYFQRPQAIQLVDWVLQQHWGLSRRPVPR